MDSQLANNLTVFQEICSKYGCNARVMSSRKMLFNVLSIRFLTPINEPEPDKAPIYKASSPLYIKMKSLENPNWEKLEEIVVNYAVLHSFTE